MPYIFKLGLNPRDDLESLAYTLLSVLRGGLPWDALCRHGTQLGKNAQVRERKLAWTGLRLARGYPIELGQLLDNARALEFNERIDYARYRVQLERLRKVLTESPHVESKAYTVSSLRSNVPLDSDGARDESMREPRNTQLSVPTECPVEVGQLIYAQVLARASIEGYSLQGLDPWHDPALSFPEWNTVARPAVVIGVEFDPRKSLYKIQVVSIGRGTPANPGEPARGVAGPFPLQNELIGITPSWPTPETYCYTFPRAPWFYCLPDQVRLPFTRRQPTAR